MIRIFQDERGPRIDVVDEPTLLHTLDAVRSDVATAVTYVGDDGAEEAQSFAALVEEAEGIARGLMALGLRRGDRVGLVLPRAREFVPVFWGAVRAGMVPVPMAPPVRVDSLDAWLGSAASILDRARARLLIVDRDLHNVAWALPVEGLRGVRTRADIPADAAGDLPAPDDLSPDEPCFLQFTSGSTSRPRGVRVTFRSLVANTDAIMRDGLETRPADRTLSWLPLYHDMGLIGFVIATIRYRTPTVLLPTLRFVMKPAIWMQAAARHRATITFAPNFAYALATRRTPEPEALDLSCLRVLGCGAEPIQADTQRAFFDHFTPSKLDPRASLACYGMAEATLAMSFMDLDAPLHTERVAAGPYRDEGRCVPTEGDDSLEFVCCGRPMLGHAITVLGPDGDPLGERRVGELCFSGPSVADGYEGDPESTAAVFTRAGIRTGDLGYVADGRVFVTGRKKDLLILNGRNYDPQDVEARVAEVGGVRKGNVAAFTVPGPDSERLVVAFEAAPGAPDDVEKLAQEHLQRALGLRATFVRLTPGSLPKTSSGKLQRRGTRERYLAGTLGVRPPTWKKHASVASATVRGLGRRVARALRPEPPPDPSEDP